MSTLRAPGGPMIGVASARSRCGNTFSGVAVTTRSPNSASNVNSGTATVDDVALASGFATR